MLIDRAIDAIDIHKITARPRVPNGPEAALRGRRHPAVVVVSLFVLLSGGCASACGSLGIAAVAR
jgi:hypothetical protein